MNWLNLNSGAITAIATAVLVFITAVYVYFTYRILRATNQPDITVYLRPHEASVNVVVLWIENAGTGVARNVRFTGDLSLGFKSITLIKDIGFLKNGIDVLGPGQKIEHCLGSILENPEALERAPFEITVTYSRAWGYHQIKRIFHLNFHEFIGVGTIGGSPLYEIAKTTKEIQKNLHKLTTGSSKPIIRTVPLSEDSLRQQVSALEGRMAQLPQETQQEVLRTMASILKSKEQEVQEERHDEATTSDQTRGEHINEKSVEEGYAILDELVGFTERERKNDIC